MHSSKLTLGLKELGLKMKRKRPSPSASENEFDISEALVGHNGEEQDGDELDFRLIDGVRLPGKDVLPDFEESDSGSDDDDDAYIAAKQAASNRKSSNLRGRTVKKGGGFQAMGLSANLLKAITRKGFSVPTPIQRKTIPLILDRKDVVGMARTGSGKTAAFVIPMIERLKSHSAKVGSRAVILSPSRELAIQTLKVVKEMGRGTDLRIILLVGGESMEDQFAALASNPDVIIATPGRFHHLKVEMNLDLSSVEYIVFDEADRLFELGFAVQLTEILHALPTVRQTLLFSATLPKSLVEFAKAGLQEPTLVRLDAESKISPDLESAFFTVKSGEKEGALLQIIRQIIQIPIAPTTNKGPEDGSAKSKKRQIKDLKSGDTDRSNSHSTIVFAATKHHVEYITTLLRHVGYQVSYVYGTLDQTARKLQVDAFRQGHTNILVVTDVAARGIDIPVLSNVINYDFPSQPKVYVHRVGRTARAGRKGWSYSLIQDTDLPYLIDLQLFLSRQLVIGRQSDECNFSQDIVVGGLPRDKLGSSCEWAAKIVDDSEDLIALRSVAVKGEKLYTKSRNAASAESVKRAKEIMTRGSHLEPNALFATDANYDQYAEREDILARLRNYRPQETIFEIGKRGIADETVELLQKARRRIDAKKNLKGEHAEKLSVLPVDASLPSGNAASAEFLADAAELSNDRSDGAAQFHKEMQSADVDMDEASDEDLIVTFSHSSKHQESNGSHPWEEREHFMSYTPQLSNAAEEKAYGVHSGSSSNAKGGQSDFLSQAKTATIDLLDDDLKGFGHTNQAKMRWDKRSKKYVNRANDEDGSRGTKMIRGESGLKIAASLRSGRFESWKRANHIDRLPRVGDVESRNNIAKLGPRYRHKGDTAPKNPDKFRDDYFKQKKKVDAAKERGIAKLREENVKSELRNVEAVRKQRRLKERRRERNGRPSRSKRKM